MPRRDGMTWGDEVLSACSRLANALANGNARMTFSCECHHRTLLGQPGAELRERLVDLLAREPGHCATAWREHWEESRPPDDANLPVPPRKPPLPGGFFHALTLAVAQGLSGRRLAALFRRSPPP